MGELAARFHKGEIDFLKWSELSIEVYKEFGLTEKKLLDICENKLTLHTGALETIKELQARGIKVGVISGGIYNMYEYISQKFGLMVDYISFGATLEFDKKDGKLIGGKCNSYDYEGKIDMFKIYCKRADAKTEETLYVGDAKNDIPLFKISNGIAFASDSEELKKYAKHIIGGNDMREMLQYVE